MTAGVVQAAATMVACTFAGVCGGLCSFLFVKRREEELRRKNLLGLADADETGGGSRTRSAPLRYAEALSRRLAFGAVQPLSFAVRAGNAEGTRSGAFFKSCALKAGCVGVISVDGYCEARVRLSLAAAACGALLGASLSNELAVVLGTSCAFGGWATLPRSLRAAQRQRAAEVESRLSEMLEVVALGLRSGLTFDRSFALYGLYFDAPFARTCRTVSQRWSLGLATREDSLRDLARSYDCEQLARVVESMVRSLRFGTSLAERLEDASGQVRAAYRSSLEEKVAKAPVKMMLPTGTLILPAMLLLVMGPVLLELAQGF